jgi:hypothetical protein
MPANGHPVASAAAPGLADEAVGIQEGDDDVVLVGDVERDVDDGRIRIG